MRGLCVATATVLTICSTTLGGGDAFDTFDAKTYVLEQDGHVYQVLDLYAKLHHSTIFYNVSHVDAKFTNGDGDSISPLFHHSDLADGSWAPQLVADEAIDTYLTIGQAPLSTGPDCPVFADPNFVPGGFDNGGQVIPPGGGWYNSWPPNGIGLPEFDNEFDSWAVFLGRFVIEDGHQDVTMNFFGYVSAGSPPWNLQPGSGQFTFATLPAASCLGDIDGDGIVDGIDLATLLLNWGGTGSADLDGDGIVDGSDLAILLLNWGTCP